MVTISIAAPRPADVRVAVLELAPAVAARNRVVVRKDEVDKLAELAAQHRYTGHFREIEAVLTRYLLMRDPGRTTEQAWRAALDLSGGPELSASIPATAMIPRDGLRSFELHLEHFTRLQLARQASSVADLARRAHQTSATIYAWLKRVGLAPEDIGDTEAVRRAAEAEAEALQPYLPLLQDLIGRPRRVSG